MSGGKPAGRDGQPPARGERNKEGRNDIPAPENPAPESRRAGRRRGCPAAAPPGGARPRRLSQAGKSRRSAGGNPRWGFFVLCFQSPFFFFFSPGRLNRKGKKQEAGLSPSFRSGGSGSSSSSGGEAAERREGRSPDAVGIDALSHRLSPGRISRRRSRPRRGERRSGQDRGALLQEGAAGSGRLWRRARP